MTYLWLALAAVGAIVGSQVGTLLLIAAAGASVLAHRRAARDTSADRCPRR